MAGLGPNDWIGEDLAILPMGVAVLLAGWARPVWLQWAGVIVMAAVMVFFLVTYALPAG